MLERRSALASARPYKSSRLQIGEAPGFTLTQVAGLVGEELPAKVGIAASIKGRTVMRVGPDHFWFTGPEHDGIASELQGRAVLTPLSHSRTRIFLDGTPSRDVLAKGIPLDFHPRAFTPGNFAMTGLHHTPVLIHCIADNGFHLYAMRSFAMSVWEWLTDAALEYGVETK